MLSLILEVVLDDLVQRLDLLCELAIPRPMARYGIEPKLVKGNNEEAGSCASTQERN
jgi:hypothetical protein